jgi:hypothetical protein
MTVKYTSFRSGSTISNSAPADASPGAEFEMVEPDLKDVYFTVMAGHHGRRAPMSAAGAEAAS